MRLTIGELNRLENRIKEIQDIFDNYVYIDDDVLNNLDNELSDIIYKLEISLKIAESEERLNICQLVKH